MSETQSFNPKNMTSEQFRTMATAKHSEMVRSLSAQILEAKKQWTGKEEDFVVALFEIGEDIIDMREKFRMRARNVDTAFVAASKSELINLLSNFESPRNGQKVFLPMIPAIDIHEEGKVCVAAFCFQNGSVFFLTEKELEENAVEAEALRAKMFQNKDISVSDKLSATGVAANVRSQREDPPASEPSNSGS